MQFEEAPALPRAPTEIRTAASADRPATPPRRPPGDLPPPPPRLPSMRDVRLPKKSGAPALLARVRAQVQKLPDPTLLFLALTVLILALRAFAPHVLRSWAARATLPPALALSVAAAALWRHTVTRFVKPPEDRKAPPPGILPNAPALVRRGVALRKRDAAVSEAEETLRKGQVKLEVLRKEIESRLPSHNSIATLMEQDAQSAASKDRAVEPLGGQTGSASFVVQRVAGSSRSNSGRQVRSTASFH